MVTPPVCIAIDWSGAKDAASQRKHIWAATITADAITLEAGRTREEITAWIIAQKRHYPQLLVGLDFSFSMPLWYVKQHAATIEEFWTYLTGNAEQLLLCEQPPFWGRAAHPRPRGMHRDLSLRQTELQTVVHGQHPKSAFQLNYPGAVGTGTLRGIPHIQALLQAGFSIWPFQPRSTHTVVEVYPRLFTRIPVSRMVERERFLRTKPFDRLPANIRETAVHSADAFDALVAALSMRDGYKQFVETAGNLSAANLLEGKIFAQPEPEACTL